MKKIISIAFAALLAGFAISCQKEELASEKTDAVQYTFNITVNDRSGFDNGASTKGAATYKSAWENGDKIFLFFKPTDGSILTDIYATLTYNGSSWDGTVSSGQSSLGEGGTLTAVYVYKLGNSVTPSYSDSKWTIATGNVFYNCQTGVTYTVSGSEISATLNLVAPSDFVQFYVEGATGALTCDKVKGWKDVAIGSDMTVSNVTCTGYMEGFSNSSDSNVKEYYGRIVNNGTSLKTQACTFSVVKDGKVYERTATPSSDARSFKMTVSTTDWLEAVGKLPGLFTVGKGTDGKAGTADDIQVRFSQGNLWYGKVGSATTETWNFETNQYDSTPSADGSWSTDHISHFFWSEDASVARAASYSGSVTSGGDVFFTNATTETAKADFTVNGVTGKYRTLSTAEWQYLFNTRTMTNERERYSNAVNGVTIGGTNYKGVFLYPDNYNGEVVSGSMTWEQINAAGIVFLPAAGRRKDSKVSTVGVMGYYWSSTAYGSSNAYLVHFDSDVVGPGQNDSRDRGSSVRLITECQ